MKKVKVIILRTAGTNCDQETRFAFEYFGAQVDLIHINNLLANKTRLKDYHILTIPGGFTYGDDIESGRILANELIFKLGEDLCRFITDKKLILGICNGFQVLVKAGILPGPLTEEERSCHDCSQKVTLTHNDSGKFEDRWIYLEVTGKSVWTEGLKETLYLPVAHAEGKFAGQDKKILEKLDENHQVSFRYTTKEGEAASYPHNPNGSQENIAGISDAAGRVLGIMPHPERHFLFTHHPHWTRLANKGKLGDGARIFENGIKYVKENLL